MAIDLRLEKFALDTFLRVERCVGIPDLLLSRWKDYEDMPKGDSTKEIHNLVLFRFHLFRNRLMDLEKDLVFYEKNDVDFYRYLREHMTDFFLYANMNVFDKLFMSCAVATKMSHLLYMNAMYRDTTPLSWAMYFEAELKEEFFAAGSWEALRKYAQRSNSGMVSNWEGAWLQSVTFQTDLELAEKLCKDSRRLYCMDDVIDTFKQAMQLDAGNPSCPDCLPLFEVLFSLSYGRKLVTDLQLVEGYSQIFLRMWYADKTNKMFELIVDRSDGDRSEEKLELAFAKTKATITQLFHRRVFGGRNPDVVANGVCDSECCLFCGKDKKKRSVAYLKSVIRRIVSDAELISGTGSVDCKKQVSDEIEKRKRLRLFLALNTEPVLSKVKANIEKEFGSQDVVQSVTASMDSLKVQEEKERPHQKKNKKKKKKKKVAQD